MGVWEPGPGATAGNDLFIGDATDEIVDGLAGNDTLRGGEGDDTLEGGLGDDVIDGGAGIDTVSYATAPAGVGVNISTALPQDTQSAGTDTLISIENVIGSLFNDVLRVSFSGFPPNVVPVLQGGAGDDRLFGGPQRSVLQGGEGNDTLFAGIGGFREVFDGGDGRDIVSFANIQPGAFVRVSLDIQGLPQPNLTLVSIEGVIGSDGDDTLIGSAQGDFFNGGAGSDALYAGDGDDILEGDDPASPFQFGSDFLDGASGDDHLDGGPGGDVLLGRDGDDVIIIGISNETDTAFGGAGDDVFLQTGAESPFSSPQAGLHGEAGFDTLSYAEASAALSSGVIVQLSGYTTDRTPAVLVLATFDGIEGAVGTDANDALIGDASNNRLEGGAGADWLVGGGGDDWFVQGIDANIDRLFGGTASGDAGFDTIDYSTASAAVTVQLSGYATSAGTTLANFSGIEAAVGSVFNDALIGNALNNRIAGGAGADWLVGGDGNDTFVQVVDTSSIDRLFGDAGLDTIDYSGAGTGVVVQLSGYAATNGGGNVTLATFTNIENAIGSSFADALIGNGGANRITGGGGADWLVGGGGADTFAYQGLGDGAGDSIRDFSQAQLDRIDLSAIDANPLTGLDDAFIFANIRHAGVVGEAVVTNFGGSSQVSLYLDADNIADMTIQVVHQQGTVMNASDFVL